MYLSAWTEAVSAHVHAVQPDWTQLPVGVWATILPWTAEGPQPTYGGTVAEAV